MTTATQTLFGREVRHKTHAFTGDQWTVSFPNGYGASIIRGPYSYGGPEGYFEVAVVHGPDTPASELCYATPVTEDVIGWLDEANVGSTLDAIEALSPNAVCNHRHPR